MSDPSFKPCQFALESAFDRNRSLASKLLVVAGCLLAAAYIQAQPPSSPVGAPVPHRFVVVYRSTSIPARISARAVGLSVLSRHPAFGVAVLQSDSDKTEDSAIADLRADPTVAYVIHDHILFAHRLILRPPVAATLGVTVGAPPPAPAAPAYDTYYTGSPQNWAVVQSGGFGGNVQGGPAHGPWDTTLGARVRIAILDSGVDQNHPDIAPNLVYNLSEIDQSSATGLPSPCDDASPQDQLGHGTWTASLAAGALGMGTGLTIGVAPAATLLNIKVLERLPDPSSGAADTATQCATGQGGGLLSWVIQGIEDAIAQHADIINLSLGTLVDLNTGEGAGLKAAFDRVTYAATQAGAVVIASAGNEGLDLSNPRYIELPAQARGVLAIVASTNPACQENTAPGAACAPGPASLPYYSNFGPPLQAIAFPGGSYPDPTWPTPDTAISGWIRGACSNGVTHTADGPPVDSTHSFGCFDLGHRSYVQAMGTSASAALASGAAALVRAAHPAWTPDLVVAALRAAAVPTASLPGAPLLNPALLLP